MMRKSEGKDFLRLLALSAAALSAVCACTSVASTQQAASVGNSIAQTVSGAQSLPAGVTLKQIGGGPHYYSKISAQSAWMDEHILVGGWLEEPLTAAEVHYDVAMGNNIYWSLAANPLDTKDCGGSPCRVDFNVIRKQGMHASAPDVTPQSGSETVAYEGSDEADLDYGPGSTGWSPGGSFNTDACIPSGSQCGYTVANFYDTGRPTSDGSTGYPVGKKPITQGFGKGVLFWETNTQAAKFLKYSDTLSADSYWMTDTDLSATSQGACALLPASSKQCGNGAGTGLSVSQRALPANYAFDVTRLQALEALVGENKPITVDVETGCPMGNGKCISPKSSVAAAWHALIAGARGIIWFQHNFSGPCVDDSSFYDGSNPQSPMYNCQQTPSVTLHDMVTKISAFNHEVSSLNKVLLSPFAANYVNSGKADVSVMAKDDAGKFYVFAASGKPAQPPANNQLVTFRVAGGYTGPVTVVGEHRTLKAVNGVFQDRFMNCNSYHIYEIGKLGQSRGSQHIRGN
jgi:hypothetical protein